MDTNFDPKKAAITIESFAKRCIDDYSAHKTPEAEADEQGLAKALASVWGDKNKMQAVGAELKKLGGATFSSDPNVDLITDADGSVTGINFSPSFWDHGASAKIETKKSGIKIDVTAKNGDNDPGLKTTTILSGGHIHLGPIDIDINNRP
jgi:hypothetical protein